MQAPGAEDPQSCCPIYTLQYLTAGQQQTKTCFSSFASALLCVYLCSYMHQLWPGKAQTSNASDLLFCSSLSSFICSWTRLLFFYGLAKQRPLRLGFCSSILTCPPSAFCCTPTAGEQGFLVTAGGAAQGLVLKCSMEVEGALTAHPTHQAGVMTLGVSQGGRLLMQGFSNGMIRVSEAGLDSTSIIGRPAACQMSLCSRHTYFFRPLRKTASTA